ncbi:MAG: radical SAM protein [bacterium]|nr:radical SAM protein [bacterium]
MNWESEMTKARVGLGQPSDGLAYWKGRATKRMPLGLAYIAAALARAGHEVKTVDASLHDLSIEETAQQLLANDPHIVGLTFTTPLYHQAVAIMERIKQLSPKTVVVVGGPHVTYLPRATLETSKADFVCIGEGEVSMPAIVDCVLGGGDPSGIVGIAYDWESYQGQTQSRRNKVGEDRDKFAPPVNLNAVPIPARELFEYSEYYDLSRSKKGPQTGAMFSRGCPGKCSFCDAANTIVRWRDIENVINELRIVESLGIPNLFVMDDTFTVQRKRVLALSKGIVESGVKLNISVQLRLDQTDPEICDAMFASGVRYVHPGIESGNEDIIKAIGKGPRESKHHMREKVRLLQQYPWTVRCSYVFGMPGETEDQMLETIAFAAELNADENAFSILVPYPGSPLWTTALDLGKVNPYMDFSRFLYYRTVGVNLSAVPTNRLLALNQFAYDYVGNRAFNFPDVSISSGNRPHVPFDPKDIANLPNLPGTDFSVQREEGVRHRPARPAGECTVQAVRDAFEQYLIKHPVEETEEEAMV